MLQCIDDGGVGSSQIGQLSTAHATKCSLPSRCSIPSYKNGCFRSCNMCTLYMTTTGIIHGNTSPPYYITRGGRLRASVPRFTNDLWYHRKCQSSSRISWWVMSLSGVEEWNDGPKTALLFFAQLAIDGNRIKIR